MPNLTKNVRSLKPTELLFVAIVKSSIKHNVYFLKGLGLIKLALYLKIDPNICDIIKDKLKKLKKSKKR